MPSDWLFHFMTRPSGLAAIAAAVALPFAIWVAVLGKSHAFVGIQPLVFAYLLAAVGLIFFNFGYSYIEFNSRVSSSVLPESERWAIVPGWTIYSFVLSLVVALPLLGFVGVPLAALLLRAQKLSLMVIVGSLVAFWLAMSSLAWAFPTNEWHRMNRLDSMLMFLSSFAAPVAFVGAPFLGSIYFATRARRAEA